MKTGVVAGNFDVIHPGYMQMFKECKIYCDSLIVFLHEDPSLERPEKIKPILSVDERIDILMGIRYIDSVIPYKTENDLIKLLETTHIDVRFLGEDYFKKSFTGDYLNIPIQWIFRTHGWSTTKFKQLISQSLSSAG